MNVIAVFQPPEPLLAPAGVLFHRIVCHSAVQLAVLAALAAPCLAAPVPSEAPDTDWSQLVSVRELLQLDTERALARARAGRSGREGVMPDTTSGRANRLELLAIYGVGSRLLAEVQVGNDRYLYLRGQALPVGANRSLPEQTHRLVAIEGACVRMAFQSTEKTACLGQSVKVGQR